MLKHLLALIIGALVMGTFIITIAIAPWIVFVILFLAFAYFIGTTVIDPDE